VPGRKRGLAVDVLGLVVAVVVLAVSAHENTAGIALLDRVAAQACTVRQALHLGSTFWDTANIYGQGTSEEITGRMLRKHARREDVVLATKVFGKMHDGPGGSGLSRKAIMEQGRRLPQPSGHRLHRPVPDPPFRS
jgi:aryl-alcohol dehydrogenase-like predicted oxidoreductase